MAATRIDLPAQGTAATRVTPRRLAVSPTRVAAHAVLLVMAFVSVAPFVWMFLGSFKTFNELTQNPPTLLPAQWTFDNYQVIIQQANFARALWNSVLVATVVTLATLTTSSLAGYVFAKYRFWGKEQLFVVLLSTMMIPFSVVLVPLYVTISALSLANTLWALIVTGLCSTFGIFLMRQFIEGIPGELVDAGRIDGASERWIFTRVILPLATAPISALAVFTFLGNWDSYLWPLVVISSDEIKTVPLVLAGLRSLFWTQYQLYMAGSVLTVAPVLLVYAFAQRQFIRGIALTGMKA